MRGAPCNNIARAFIFWGWSLKVIIAGRSAHSASPSRDLPVAGLFVSFSPFSVLGLFVVFEGLYVLWIGGGYVKRVLGYLVVRGTLLDPTWKMSTPT